MLQLDEQEESTQEIERSDKDNVNQMQGSEHEHHLSLNTLKRAIPMGTIRFEGTIYGVNVQVLIDSRSSDNFLQPRLAHCLKLIIEPTTKFQALVGNGNSLTVEGRVSEVEVQIQGHSLKLSVYLLPISGAYLVLKPYWLATLGSHIIDYSALTLKFLMNEKFITLQGNKPKLPTPA